MGHALELAKAIGARITVLHAQPNVPIPVMGMGEMLDARTIDALMEANRKDTERILAVAQEQARARRSGGQQGECDQRSAPQGHSGCCGTAGL